MFSSCGSKLKTVARILFLIEIGFWAFYGFLLFAAGIAPASILKPLNIAMHELGGILVNYQSHSYPKYIVEFILAAPFVIGLGGLSAWLTTLPLYALGEIAEHIHYLKYVSQEPAPTNESRIFTDPERTPYESEQIKAQRIRQAEERARERIRRAKRHEEAIEVKMNQYGECTCPVCRKMLYFENHMGHTQCPKCKASLKITK